MPLAEEQGPILIPLRDVKSDLSHVRVLHDAVGAFCNFVELQCNIITPVVLLCADRDWILQYRGGQLLDYTHIILTNRCWRRLLYRLALHILKQSHCSVDH